MSLVNEQTIFAQDFAKLIQYAASIGFIVTLGEAYRTEEQQKIYFEKKMTKTMDSMHLKRCAVDLNFFRIVDGKAAMIDDKEALVPLGNFWVGLDKKNQCGIKWGWDTNHFERKV